MTIIITLRDQKMIRILIGCVIGFYVSELNLIPEIINFTNEVGLTDYFIDSLEGMKQEETS